MRYRDTKQGSAEQGFTLPELLIALVLGLTLMGAVLSAYLTTLKTSGDNNEQAQLNYNLRASLDLILSDLKRAGGVVHPLSTASTEYASNPFMADTSHLQLWNCNAENECPCVTLSYDLDGDGDPYTGTMNHFGYKLSGDRLQIRTGSTVPDGTVHPGCDYDNPDNTWEALTEDDITITEFSISYINSDGNIIAAPEEIEVPNSAPTGRLQERNLQVTISGTKDEFSLTVTGKVRVRNDRYYTP